MFYFGTSYLGVKLTWGHAHKTKSWYLLGVTFKKSDEHPSLLYGSTPPPPTPGVETSFVPNLSRFQSVHVTSRLPQKSLHGSNNLTHYKEGWR